MYRRDFVKNLSVGLSGLWASSGLAGQSWQVVTQRKDSIETLNSARNLVFVFLDGGPSHIDTFDMKQTINTPSFMDAQNLANGLMWPTGIMPELATMSDKYTLLRSISAIEAVHERATYHMLTSHRQNAARIADVPHFSSVLSYFFDAARQATDSLPTSIWIGPNPGKNGLFPIEYLGLQLSQNGQVRNLTHQQDGLDARLQLMDQMRLAQGPVTDKRDYLIQFQDQARSMMSDPILNSLIQAEGDQDPYGDDRAGGFMSQVDMAIRVLDADRGTRVFQLQLGGWDHHDQIYNSLPSLAGAFDAGMAHLLRELDSLPAKHRPEGTLLDETLVVAVGEFGRTTGRLNNSQGRDHYPYVVPALVAGGGVIGNRAIGSTTSDGSSIVDPGWSLNRYMTISDLFATIYSALGVDYTTTFQDTPSGRTFELTPAESFGEVDEIGTLFA